MVYFVPNLDDALAVYPMEVPVQPTELPVNFFHEELPAPREVSPVESINAEGTDTFTVDFETGPPHHWFVDYVEPAPKQEQSTSATTVNPALIALPSKQLLSLATKQPGTVEPGLLSPLKLHCRKLEAEKLLNRKPLPLRSERNHQVDELYWIPPGRHIYNAHIVQPQRH